MNCFKHRELTAVGTCKICSKAVCPECVLEGDRDITCSPVCEEESGLFRQLNLRAFKLYGISEKPRGLPQSVVAPMLMSGILVCAAALGFWLEPKIAFVPAIFLLMAFGVGVGAFLAWRRHKENGLNI